jgi:hypothetical protein
MAVENLVLETARLSDAAVQRLQSNLQGYEQQVWERLQAFLNRFDVKDGSFVPDAKTATLINAIKREMRGVIEMEKLAESTQAFVANFDDIAENVRAIHGEQNGIVVPKSLVNGQKAWAVDQTEYALKDANIHPAFMEPVRKLLFTRINGGKSVAETEQILKALVIGPDGKNGVLTQWAGQVATDAINQYEGVVQSAIATEMGLTGVRYVNSIIETSRSQCVRWVEMEWMPEAIIADEIAWAKKNGSGMVFETTAGTFLIYRGGYRCRHKGIPVRDELARRMAAQRSAPPKPSPKEIQEARDKAERQQALQELTSMRKQMDDYVQRAQTIAASVSGAEKEVIEAAVVTGKELEAEALTLANLSDKWSKFHTSGTTPDAELGLLINDIQWDGMHRIPEILKGVAGEVKKQLSAKMKALAGQMGELKAAVKAAFAAANNSKTAKALKEAKYAVTNSINGMKAKRDEMHALAKELNTTPAWETFNTADDYVDEAIVEGHPVYSILEPPKKPKPKPKPSASSAVIDVSKWKMLSGKKGSNPGNMYEAPDGSKWYVKEPPSEDHVRNEVLAAELYRRLGIEVPEVRIATNGTKPLVASRIVEGAPDPQKVQTGALASVLDGFAADAWLANWDVVGSSFDNLVLGPKGAVRIDMGGSLRYRAQGTAKGASFGNEVGEFETLRNGSNPQAAAAFAKLVPKEVFEKAKAIRDFSQGEELKKAVEAFGPLDKVVATELLEKLKMRAMDLYLKSKAWAEKGPDVKASTVTKFFDPLKLRIKAKNIAEIADKLKAVEHSMLDVFQPKGLFAGMLNNTQAKKIREHMQDVASRLRTKGGDMAASSYSATTKKHAKELAQLRLENPRALDEIVSYTGSAYSYYNKLLYTRDKNELAELEKYRPSVNKLEEGLKQFEVAEAVVVYRGVDGEYATHLANMGQALVGKFIRMPAFTSTSISPIGAFSGSVKLNILLPKGSRAAYVDSVSRHTNTEFEMLIQRGAYMAVIGVGVIGGKTVIDCVLLANG